MAQRHANARGLYRVKKPEAVKGRNIVIIDDVVTSGATTEECKQVPETAGARSVTGIVLARTVRKAWWPYHSEAVTA